MQYMEERANLEKPHSFRFKEDEDQFLFNERVADCLDELDKELEKA